MFRRGLLNVALRGPGKALWLVSAAGWLALAWLLSGDGSAHAAHAPVHGTHALPFAGTTTQSVIAFALLWLAMIAAMGPPLLLREIGYLWRASLRRMRPLTVGGFVTGYVGCWLLAGALLTALAARVNMGFATIAAVAIWHFSPLRQRVLNACHHRPTLRVFGTPATWDALGYGTATGLACSAACGHLMLLVLAATNHHLAAMALVSAVAIGERYLPPRRPAWHLPFMPARATEWPAVPFTDRSRRSATRA